MDVRRPGTGIFVLAVLAMVLAALTFWEMAHTYASDNAASCGGGLWRLIVVRFYAQGVIALLALLIPLVGALVETFSRRRWVLGSSLLGITALGVLLVIGSASGPSYDRVGFALGYGCSWLWPVVTQFFAVLLVAVSTLVVLLMLRRRPT